MISTVTVNPAIDYNLKTDKLALDEVNRVELISKTAAGKGINVAKAIKNLGLETEALGCVGGATGEYIVKELAADNIAADFNQVAKETRINFKITDNLNQETKVNQEGLPLNKDEIKAVSDKVVKKAQQSKMIVLGGSLPQNLPDDFYQDLIGRLKECEVKIFLDTSGPPLKLALEAKPTLIKPNLRELEELMGQDLSFQEVISVSQDLVASGIELVVVSLGADGALLVGEGIWYAKPPQVEVESTVGAGDSMVGALAVGYIKGYSLKKMLEYAVAMSTATILLPGSEIGKLNDVEKWKKEVKIKSVEG